MHTGQNTKQRLLDAGLGLLLEHGYHDLGVQALLAATGTPKGSFYHHFSSKQDFALQVVDQYMARVHETLDDCLSDTANPPLARMRTFFEAVAVSYQGEGYLGCLLGGLGQELAAVNSTFAHKIESCFLQISGRMSACLEEARAAGDIPADSDPERLAGLLVDSWEGAALRSRLQRSPDALVAMLDFYFDAAARAGG